MAFFTLFWVIFWRQIWGSILSFVKNSLYTASNYTKMSLKNSQAVKDLELVDALVYSLLSIHSLIAFFNQYGFLGHHLCWCSFLSRKRITNCWRLKHKIDFCKGNFYFPGAETFLLINTFFVKTSPETFLFCQQQDIRVIGADEAAITDNLVSDSACLRLRSDHQATFPVTSNLPIPLQAAVHVTKQLLSSLQVPLACVQELLRLCSVSAEAVFMYQ